MKKVKLKFIALSCVTLVSILGLAGFGGEAKDVVAVGTEEVVALSTVDDYSDELVLVYTDEALAEMSEEERIEALARMEVTNAKINEYIKENGLQSKLSKEDYMLTYAYSETATGIIEEISIDFTGE